jgi:hypothetical protein
VPVDAQCGVGILDQLEHQGRLGRHLLGGAQHVTVVERHSADAGQAADHAGALVAVHGAQLGDAHRKVPPAVLQRGVDEQVVRAVHRPEDHLLVTEPHGREHVVGVVRPVTRPLVQLTLGEGWRSDVLVAGVPLHVEDVALERRPDGGAGWQPQREPGAHLRVGGEQPELPAELTMIVRVRRSRRVGCGGVAHVVASWSGGPGPGRGTHHDAPGRDPGAVTSAWCG